MSKKLGTRRGQCKSCMAEIKAEQKDPTWMPSCNRCGEKRPRSGPGRRLCAPCFDAIYDEEDVREKGSHRLKLKDCTACGAKRLRGDHFKGSSLCPVCRSVPQGRRKRLKSLFNMTPREFVTLLAEQRELCAICSRRFNKTRPANIDHQHREPRLIRGAICGPCNTILGLAKDDTKRLRAAADYLESPPAQTLFPERVASEEANRNEEGYRVLRRAA